MGLLHCIRYWHLQNEARGDNPLEGSTRAVLWYCQACCGSPEVALRIALILESSILRAAVPHYFVSVSFEAHHEQAARTAPSNSLVLVQSLISLESWHSGSAKIGRRR